MNNANLIKVSENQVKAILKNKNKSQYFDVYDTENNFKIGRLKISSILSDPMVKNIKK